MNIYLARQPIYDQSRNIQAYEFLYRSSDENRFVPAEGGEDPTIKLISNMMVEFDLQELIGDNKAFINCSKGLFLSDTIRLMDPNYFVLEILEDTIVDEEYINRVIELKELGYRLALDDYTGQDIFDPILDYVDYIKVDYPLTTEVQRKAILSRNKKKVILAEKIETQEEYLTCIKSGFTLFQGYYFSKPIMLSKGAMSISSNTQLQIWNEASKEDVNFHLLSEIIYKDASLTYKLLRKMKTLRYYRGSDITSINQALMMMGSREVRRWIMLLLMGGLSSEVNDRYIKLALTRAIFTEALIKEITHRDEEDGAYIAGLFSIFDTLFKEEFASMLNQLSLPEEVKVGLLGGENMISDILIFVKEYEKGEWENLKAIGRKYNFASEKVTALYMKALSDTEKAFTGA